MSYNKPEVILFSSIRAIESSTDKGCPLVIDSAQLHQTSSAYEADE